MIRDSANANRFDIPVYDALGKDRLVRDNIDFAPDVNYQGETYSVASNGREEVVIRLREDSADDNCVRFNGIVIVPGQVCAESDPTDTAAIPLQSPFASLSRVIPRPFRMCWKDPAPGSKMYCAHQLARDV